MQKGKKQPVIKKEEKVKPKPSKGPTRKGRDMAIMRGDMMDEEEMPMRKPTKKKPKVKPSKK